LATGFDTDVANELAARIGVSSQVVVVAEREMARGGGGQWDVALPSVPTWTVDGSRFVISEPYYYWPHLVVVGDDSPIAALADLANVKVCTVAGDGGEAWLSGGESGAFGTAPPTSLITLPDDDACLAALATGQVDALVTAHLSSADIAVRSGIHSIGGPPPEPRALIVERMSAGSADATDLVAAINSAIDAARADGTLTRFSQSRFGGSDLTTSN
jgi:ABC-type amino acid transport substrate-binding protein